jgi:hypothetical protein
MTVAEGVTRRIVVSSLYKLSGDSQALDPWMV